MFKTIIFLTGVSVLVLGVSFYIKTQIDLIKSISTTTKGFKLLKIGIDNASILFKFVIKNDSIAGIKVLETNLEIYFNGIKISDVNQKGLVEIKPKNENDFSVIATFNPKKIVSDIKSVFNLDNFSDIIIEAKGSIRVKKFGLLFIIPVNYKTTFKELIASK